jgi:hypothetical protein
MAWRGKGEFARAIADLENAVALNKFDPAPPWQLALTRYFYGDFKRAAEDFARLREKNRGNQVLMWLHMAQARSGSDDRQILLEAAQALGERWPAPVLRLFGGQTTPQEMLAVAQGDVKLNCQAYFYVGKWHLLRGEHAPGIAALGETQTRCGKNSLEYVAAQVELKSR